MDNDKINTLIDQPPMERVLEEVDEIDREAAATVEQTQGSDIEGRRKKETSLPGNISSHRLHHHHHHYHSRGHLKQQQTQFKKLKTKR